MQNMEMNSLVTLSLVGKQGQVSAVRARVELASFVMENIQLVVRYETVLVSLYSRSISSTSITNPINIFAREPF